MICPAVVMRYLPQILVFLSGLGFAVQGLYIGILGHKGTLFRFTHELQFNI